MIGAGGVGTRKALSFHDSGAVVRVISPSVTAELRSAAASSDRISIAMREYSGPADIGDAEIVIAATGTASDETIAGDARSLHRLIVVAGDPDAGNFTSMSVHRAGALAVGVSAGRVPGAAVRIRDAIAKRFDSRYANALAVCADTRSKTLDEAGSTKWADVGQTLIGKDFCDRVETGTFAQEVDECR